MDFPSAWQAVLLALGAWRVWHLLAEDTLLDRPRRYVTRLPQDWDEDQDRPEDLPPEYRDRLADFISCPFCLGFWVALVWVVFYAVWPEGAVWAALPLALNAVVVGVNHMLTD